MRFDIVNPATGTVVEQYTEHGPDAIESRLAASVRGFHAWRRVGVDERAKRVRRLGAVLRENQDRYGRRMAVEMGKPIAAGRPRSRSARAGCD